MQREVLVRPASGARPLPRSAHAVGQPLHLSDSPPMVMPAVYRLRGVVIAGCLALVAAWGGYQYSQAAALEERLAQEQRHAEQMAAVNERLAAERDQLQAALRGAEQGADAVVTAGRDLFAGLGSGAGILLAGAILLGALTIAGAANPGILAGALPIIAIGALFWFGGAF